MAEIGNPAADLALTHLAPISKPGPTAFKQLRNTPAFVRSGLVGLNYEEGQWLVRNVIGFSGNATHYWTQNCTTVATDARNFLLNEQNTWPSNNADRYAGMSLRCLYAS